MGNFTTENHLKMRNVIISGHFLEHQLEQQENVCARVNALDRNVNDHKDLSGC